MKKVALRKLAKGSRKPIVNPRGGLAAEALAAKAEVPGNVVTVPTAKVKGSGRRAAVKPVKVPRVIKSNAEHKPGRLGGLFGFSVCSILRALGKAGASKEQAQAIMDANKLNPAPAAVQIQVWRGKVGKGGDPAPLTKEQLKELLAVKAPEVASKS